MSRARVTHDTWQLWVKYGSTWEHEITESDRNEAKARLREYRANCPQYPARLIKRRERNAS